MWERYKRVRGCTCFGSCLWPSLAFYLVSLHCCFLTLLLTSQADKELLRKELPNLRPECLRVLELGTTLLKRGAEEGLTLYEIASVLTRPYGDSDEEPSELEKLCLEAKHCFEVGRARLLLPAYEH